ncbi:accessory gene regulator B family protein [Anaerocolumna sp. AGMB13020]|uniref:accessory gene regulator ArgB-like protein n=1 Tax=Anaerocolumna sp. AGMB13020 TaxID=3081750 RepID=UPI00295409C9|nr:accessory gene regulator B family protein [Anaerocolumna sp. AGMB13020]WOO36378.1 accessory gene regulator B family protein [Anaerocolumna sp. AGMB13020]
MLDKTAVRLVDRLIKKGIIKEQESELYLFGIETAMLKILHLLTYIVMGVLIGELTGLLLFLAVFIPLREYSGGYHASTKLKCYIVSCLTVLSMLLLIKLCDENFYLSSVYLASISSAILLFLIPVETAARPMDESEKIYYRSKAGFIIVLLLTITLFLYMTDQFDYSFVIALSLFFEMIAAFTGKLIFIKENKSSE